MTEESDIRFLGLIAPHTDFDCLPRAWQIKGFASFLISEGVNKFLPSDISALFVRAGMLSPRRGDQSDARPRRSLFVSMHLRCAASYQFRKTSKAMHTSSCASTHESIRKES